MFLIFAVLEAYQKGACSHVCMKGQESLETHQEAKCVPAWKSMGITALHPIIFKVLEQIVVKQMTTHLESNNHISKRCMGIEASYPLKPHY